MGPRKGLIPEVEETQAIQKLRLKSKLEFLLFILGCSVELFFYPLKQINNHCLQNKTEGPIACYSQTTSPFGCLEYSLIYFLLTFRKHFTMSILLFFRIANNFLYHKLSYGVLAVNVFSLISHVYKEWNNNYILFIVIFSTYCNYSI